MLTCPQGHRVAPEQKFCPECGQPISLDDPSEFIASTDGNPMGWLYTRGQRSRRNFTLIAAGVIDVVAIYILGVACGVILKHGSTGGPHLLGPIPDVAWWRLDVLTALVAILSFVIGMRMVTTFVDVGDTLRAWLWGQSTVALGATLAVFFRFAVHGQRIELLVVGLCSIATTFYTWRTTYHPVQLLTLVGAIYTSIVGIFQLCLIAPTRGEMAIITASFAVAFSFGVGRGLKPQRAFFDVSVVAVILTGLILETTWPASVTLGLLVVSIAYFVLHRHYAPLRAPLYYASVLVAATSALTAHSFGHFMAGLFAVVVAGLAAWYGWHRALLPWPIIYVLAAVVITGDIWLRHGPRFLPSFAPDLILLVLLLGVLFLALRAKKRAVSVFSAVFSLSALVVFLSHLVAGPLGAVELGVVAIVSFIVLRKVRRRRLNG